MSASGPARSMIKIYEAGTVFEAALIRRTLEAEGVACLIPGEDLQDTTLSGSEENAIFVLEEDRDRALALLQKAWAFFDQEEGDV